MLTIPLPEAPEEETRRPRRRARRSKGPGPLPTLLVGLVGAVLGAGLMLGVYIASQRVTLPSVISPFGHSDYAGDPEVNQETSSAYSLPPFQGDSSGISIALKSHAGDPLSAVELYAQQRSAAVSLTVYAGKSAAYGSGMIFTPDGFVLTCAHVVSGSQSCTVTLSDGQELEAELVGLDEQTDLAVLKIEGESLPTVEFADSDQAVVGETVYALGDPVRPEFRGTFTDGMISGLNRSVTGSHGSMRLIQITAPVNSGNSGGPVFNAWGQVLGVVNMKINRPDLPVSIENMGMCIPSRTVKLVVEELVRTGRVVHAVLGITCREISRASARVSEMPEGLWVATIDPASDVANYDIQVGDLITAVNGQPVSSISQFKDATSGKAPGDTVTLTIWRDKALLKRLQKMGAAQGSADPEKSAETSAEASAADESYTPNFQKLDEFKVKLIDSAELEE